MNAALVADVTPEPAAVSVYPPPAGLMEHPTKPAMPPEAAAGLEVQVSAAPPVPVPVEMVPDAIASVTDAVSVGTTLPPASSMLTTGWIVSADFPSKPSALG